MSDGRVCVCVSTPAADCGNPSVPGAASGVFTSPKWPEKYERSSGLLSCSWHIQSARDHRILLHFQAFSIEGELESEFLLLLLLFCITHPPVTFIFIYFVFFFFVLVLCTAPFLFTNVDYSPCLIGATVVARR